MSLFPSRRLVACNSAPFLARTSTYCHLFSGNPSSHISRSQTPLGAPSRPRQPPIHLSSSRNTTLSTFSMSTMPATHSHSEACCNVPPVVSTGYTPKGSYDNIHDFKTYATGPDDATRGIVVVFDIFGYFDQTIQGADILANSDAHHKYKVVMPDWFKGDACPIEWYPPNTEQKQKDLGAWFGKHPPAEVVDVLPEYVTALNARYPSVKSWAVLGFCWGGKVVSLATSSALNPFKAAAVCHPAMVEPKDAAAIKVPFIMLASGEEPADKVKEFESKLEGPKHVEIFEDQVHGWMAARGDLSKERSKDEYVRGYKTVLEFFGKHWE